MKYPGKPRASHELHCGRSLLSIMTITWSTLSHRICSRVDVRWFVRRGAATMA